MKLFFLTILFFSLFGCKGQIKTKQNTMKTFDIELFNENKIKDVYSFKLNDSIRIEQNEWNDEYTSIIKPENSLFETLELYYKNGKLKSVIERFEKNFVVSYKDYDEQGNLIKEEDLDKPFTYSWEEIKKYLLAHKVDNIAEQVIEVSRWNDTEETTWTLEYYGEYNDIKGKYLIVLDGKTGEELEVKLFKGKDALGESGTIAVYDTIYKKEK